MNDSFLSLCFLSFLGPGKDPAIVEFRPGLNVISAPTSTGKSFILESIDYMLGGSRPLRDFRERIGYDRSRLGVKNDSGFEFTIERSTELGDYKFVKGLIKDSEFPPSFEILKAKHEEDNLETLSAFLLDFIGLNDKRLRKNKKGVTQSLSFRNLVRFLLVSEEQIYTLRSPIISGQYTTATAEFSLFKLLLTGVDDSSLISAPKETQAGSSAKIEIIEDLIEEYKKQIEYLDPKDLIKKIKKINLNISELDSKLEKIKGRLEDAQSGRTLLWKERDENINRLNEMNGLLSRFDLLKKQYEADLERLSAIEESGTLFATMDQGPCPCCGALPEHQCHDDACDFDVSKIIDAASAERKKIKILKKELQETNQTLFSEVDLRAKTIKKLDADIHTIEKSIEQQLSPELAQTGDKLSELLYERGEVQKKLDHFEFVQNLENKKEQIEGLKSFTDEQTQTITELPDSLLETFSLKVEHTLSEWGYPNVNRVHFDSSHRVRDFVIDGKPRASEGKGLRALSYSAVIISLLSYCKEKLMPHAGFVILDSPLVAYREPDGENDDLRGKDVKDKFYMDLFNKFNDRQVIVIENISPPMKLRSLVNLIEFTKNPNQGRYGFFPLV